MEPTDFEEKWGAKRKNSYLCCNLISRISNGKTFWNPQIENPNYAPVMIGMKLLKFLHFCNSVFLGIRLPVDKASRECKIESI